MEKHPPKLQYFEVAEFLNLIRTWKEFHGSQSPEIWFWNALVSYNHNEYFQHYYYQVAKRNHSPETLVSIVNLLVEEEWVDSVIETLYGSTTETAVL